MTLRDVFGAAAADAPDVEVGALAYDNRRVVPGTVFFCVRGFRRDGHDYAGDAIARGAVALVVDHPLALGVPEIVVEDVRAAMAPAAARLHGDPTASLRTIGITGTNGKTTSAYLVRALLEAAGESTGLLGTVTSVVGGAERAVSRTTPEAIDLQETFAAMRDAGDTHCVMEVSSHALALGRADAIHWAAAIFTNLTQDHLDFHPSMEDYFAAKCRLFREGRPQAAVVNVDDPWGARLAAELRAAGTQGPAELVTIGIDSPDAQLRATAIDSASPARRSGPAASSCAAADRSLQRRERARRGGGGARARRRRRHDRGRAARGRARPGSRRARRRGPTSTSSSTTRTRRMRCDNVLTAARPLTKRRLICVFGCGGDRDPTKRAEDGRCGRRARRPRGRHQRQPAHRGSAHDRRSDPARRCRAGSSSRRSPASRDPRSDRGGRARRCRRDRRQGPRGLPESSDRPKHHFDDREQAPRRARCGRDWSR